MKIETERLIITQFTMDMAEAVHLNSLDGTTAGLFPMKYLKLWKKQRIPLAF